MQSVKCKKKYEGRMERKNNQKNLHYVVIQRGRGKYVVVAAYLCQLLFCERMGMAVSGMGIYRGLRFYIF